MSTPLNSYITHPTRAGPWDLLANMDGPPGLGYCLMDPESLSVVMLIIVTMKSETVTAIVCLLQKKIIKLGKILRFQVLLTISTSCDQLIFLPPASTTATQPSLPLALTWTHLSPPPPD